MMRAQTCVWSERPLYSSLLVASWSRALSRRTTPDQHHALLHACVDHLLLIRESLNARVLTERLRESAAAHGELGQCRKPKDRAFCVATCLVSSMVLPRVSTRVHLNHPPLRVFREHTPRPTPTAFERGSCIYSDGPPAPMGSEERDFGPISPNEILWRILRYR